MSPVPDAEAARKVLISLRGALEIALRESDVAPAGTAQATILAGHANEILVLATWCWGAALELARSAHPQATTWRELSDVTDISDATLHSRLMSWRKKEGIR